MLDWQKHKNLRLFIKTICIVLIVSFLTYDFSWAGATEVLSFNKLTPLPQAPFFPPTLKYLSVNEANPNNYFNFLLDKGQLSVSDKVTLNKEAKQLINYFFLGITLPDNVFWVNLRPGEAERITSEQLSKTDLGRALLEQDFRLKRDMSQYFNPQNPVGRQFWEKLYSTLGKDKVKKAGITTSNRVWIVPAEAVVVETEDGALLAKSSLKVLLESEYAVLKVKPSTQSLDDTSAGNSNSLQVLTEQLMKEIIIPAITKDVNESQSYAPLRQIYHSLILAQWFKRKYKNTNSAYAQAINKGNLKGLESQLPWEKQQIWQDYLTSYNQGEYKIQDTIFGLKRMYFSGGVLFDLGVASFPLTIISQKELPEVLKQNPDLLNPDALKDSLVVITERQGNQDNLQEQPLVQDINIVSSPRSSPKQTAVQQPEKEKTDLQKSTPRATRASSPVSSIFSHSGVILMGIAASISYIVYRIIKRFTKREIKPVQYINIHLARPREQIEETLSRQPQIQPTKQRRIASLPQISNDMPLSLRQEIESIIRQLSDSVAQSSKEALARSFRPTGPAELPLPLRLSMLNQYASDRDKVVRILENMQLIMDGTDEKVLRDFERAIDNARDRVTEQALEQFDVLSNGQIYQLLTQGYLAELQKEFQRIIENQIQHMVRFHTPSFEEQNLYVSEDINERYPRLPRYIKWLLTNNPQLENDPLVRDWLNTIQMRMSQIPAFPEMIRDYSKRALNKSLYLNPELAMRVILYLSRGEDLDSLSESQARTRIQQELARNLPEDVVITDASIEEEEAGVLELPQAPQPRSLPAPDIEKTANLKARLKALIEEYQRFLTKFRAQQAQVRKAESDLAELSEGLEEAKRQNDKVIIAALKPAVEGLTSKLRRAKEAFSSIEQEKARYEEQINQIRRESGETASSPLYAVEPLSLGVGAVFAVMFGIPLYITKKILNKWYNTPSGKTLGMGASISTIILGYYAYLTNLSPEIQKAFTDPGNADWLGLTTFFIIWPLAIIAGIFAGKFGRGISHERLYWKAYSAFKKGNIDEALALINKAIKLHPKDAVDYRLLAECQRSKKRFGEAIAAYKKALEFESDNSSTHNNLGVVYVEKGDDTKGIESYRRSLELEANDPIVLGNLGQALRRKGQLLEAARILQRAQQIKPDASVTEELNEILQQTGRIPKAQRPVNLEYGKTLVESLRLDKEETWLRDRWGMREEAWWSVILGWALGGYLMWKFPYGQHWNLGTTSDPAWIGITVWVVEIAVMPFTGLLQLWLIEKTVDSLRKTYRFFKFPLNYHRLQRVNLLPSDELSDSDLKAVAPIYARMSKEYLEKIFRSWMEAGQEEKIDRLFKFGKWKSEKKQIYGDVGEYRRVSRQAATKFANTAQEQKAIFDGIDREKEKLTQKGIQNAVGLMKDILPQVIEHSRSRDEFWHWLTLVVGLPKNILDQGQRQVLTVFTDLREFDRAKEASLNKFGATNQEAAAKVKSAINSLVQKLERDGLNYPGILKKALAEINSASRNLDEFLFWVNEVMRFDKQLWSSGGFLGLLQSLIAYVRTKEEAAAKFTQADANRQKFLSDIDNLRAQLVQKGFPQASDLLKDILPELTKTCRSKEEFIYWLGELVGLNATVWRGGVQTVINNFNDLAGFKQAKEMAIEKLGTNQQEKDDLARTIDSLKAKLEEKRPSCAGLIKDVILEILKDIDSLSDPSFRRTDFIYWLSMCVNFEAAVWHAGIKQVLAGYQELKDYKKQRQELFEIFTSNTEEQKRLTTAYDNLEKGVNFSKVVTINLLKNAITKIADFSKTPREFVFWIGTLSELNPEVLEVFCRDITIVFEYYKDKRKTGDFNRLPAVLNQYHKTYRQTVLITANLLDILTDQSIDADKRVERASQYIIEQKIVKLGAPPNLVGLKDAISFEQLLSITGEDGFSSMLNFHWQQESSDNEYGSSYSDTSHQPIRQIVPKMGRDGMYSYWESQRPAYYQQFLEETKGLAPGFNRPGEKFRVAYDDKVVGWTKEEETQVMPITDNAQALKQLIQYLRMEWPNLYENFIEPKRELIKGRPLEEFVTSDTVIKIAQQLLGKVQNWQFSEQQRAVFLIKIMEIFAFSETADLRTRIGNATDDFNNLRLIAQYWERILDLIAKHQWLQENSKFYKSIAKLIKQRVATINDKVGYGGEGVLQFYLSGGTVADLFKGIVSCDCTKPGAQAFQTTIGTVIDPAFFLFKIIENGRWVGNVYSVVFKTKDNKFALFVDVFQMNLSHPLVAQSDNWNGKRDRFAQAFFKELKSYLASQGFDYLIFANTHSTQKIGTNIHNQIVKESGKSSAESLTLKKPGGIGHLSEGGLSVEYVQGAGNISDTFQSVSGYKISLDKTTPQVMHQKQRDIDYLEKLLGEMSAEETRLLALVKEKQTELKQINQRGQEAANTRKDALAAALMNASEQKKAEIQKVEYELGELRAKIQEKKLEADHLRVDLGMIKSGSKQGQAFASSPVGRALILTPVIGLLNLFLSQPAQAQDRVLDRIMSDPLVPFLIFTGLVGLVFYIIYKLFPEKPKYEPYRGFSRQRPPYEEYKLPQDVDEQLGEVLAKISPTLQGLIPRTIDIRLPFEAGIRRSQAVKALRLLFSKLIEQDSVLEFLKTQSFYQDFKQRAKELGLSEDFDQPRHEYFFSIVNEEIQQEATQAAKDIQYSVALSDRSADDILRGVASGDCTAINGSAFYNTIPQFLFDPGFFNFKILQDDKWVGNVYAIVAEKDDNPVLIIDAIQLPVWGRTWPVSVRKLSDKVLEKVVEYAQEQGFAQVLMSSFVSNFSAIHEHFSDQYSTQAIEIEKVAGFEHLKSLGLWDAYVSRNEYLETFSPQWNSGLKKVDPNNPKQTLLLRRIWERSPPSQQPESLPIETASSSPLKQDIGPQKTPTGLFKFIQRNLIKAIVTATFIIMLALPNIVNAAKFETMPGAQPNQTQVVAVVERGDNLWNIAGAAYKGVEGISQDRYAANAQWPRIYKNEVNQEQVLKDRKHKLGPQYPDTKQIVNIRPGDRLIVPGPVNLKAIGLEVPTQVQAPAPETKPSVPEVKLPKVAPSQQQVQAQQELQKLQQQKSQVTQELNQLQQKRQEAQADLENLQKQKTELTRQILDLKKQLADIQEQLRQAKERIPPALQTEETRRQALEQETNQLEQKKAQYAQEIANLEKQYKGAQEDLNRIKAQKEKAAQELEQLRKQAPQAQTQIKDLQTEIQRLEGQKKQHQQELSQLQNQRDDLQKGIEQLNKDKDKLQGELKDLKQQISDAKKILDEAKQKVQPTWKNMWDSLSWLEKTGITLLLLTGIGAIGGGIFLLRRWTRFKQLEAKTNKLQKEAEDLETRLGRLRAEEKGLIKIKQDAEIARAEAQEEARKIAHQQAQLDAQRERLKQEAADLQRQREEIEQQKQELDELNVQKQTVRNQIQDLEAQRDNLRESVIRAQQETQEAINRAGELEEEARSQAEISQAALTQEQQRLLEQLQEKRQQVTGQISVLEEQLRQARVRYGLDLSEIERRKAWAQEELMGLVSERERAKKELDEMNMTISRLIQERGNLLQVLQDLDRQKESLRSDIDNLKQEKDRLKAEVARLKKVEEIKPEVESFLERVQGLREKVHRTLDGVAPVSDENISTTLRNQLTRILGDDAEIITIPISGVRGSENIIVRINATKGYENLPQIILNAHKDIHDHGYHIGINDRDEFIRSGALDDRVGVVAILHSLSILKERFEKENIPHGQILVVFTDLEERGLKGASDLKEKYETSSAGYESLFDNTYLMITVDGPLDWETEEFTSDNTPFIIAGTYPKEDIRYKAIYDAVKKLNYPGSQIPRCPRSDGMGDHHVFRRIRDKKTGENLFVVNLRAPHTGSREDYHSNKEKTNIDEQLTPFVLWLTESVIQLNASLLNKKAGSAKGKGMFAPEEHEEVNEVILAAQREGRGLLVWGDRVGWKDAKDSFAKDISGAIAGLRRYPRVHIQGLGTIDIPEILTASNIVLILPRNNSPPGLVVKSKDSYQIAHSGETFNSIYIDETIYKQLHSFEIAVLLAHEAIELGAKQIARIKRIPWTFNLAKQIHRLAEDYEIKIVGRSPNGRGSRFDDRIEELLDFANLRRKVEVPAAPEVVKPEPKQFQDTEILMPKPQKTQDVPSAKPLTLEYPEARPEIIDNLRKLFLEGLFNNVSANLPAKLDNFPPPLAQEIRKAYELGKVKGMPLDADFMVALALFFSKLFPNHANELVQYMKNLSIYLVDNARSTYGATLSGNTFYIQRSCIEDLLGRPVTVEEIYQGIKNKDPKICVALFRIVIHEIGAAFFKLSHPANQELEEAFLAMLSKTGIKLSPNTQQEIYTINRTANLDNIARIDWAQKRNKSLDFDYAKLNLGNLLSQDEIVNPLVTPLEQGISSSDKADVATNPGGIDLSEIEIILKDEKFVSSLNPADLKILRAARALKEGQDGLAVLYIHEVRLILKDNILSEKDITQKELFQNLLSELERRELLNPEAVDFCHVLQGQEGFPEERLVIKRIK